MDEHIFSVSQVNEHIKNVMENSLPFLYVEGEILNFNFNNNGHMYFSLKDEKSSLKCVYFSFHNSKLSFLPENGKKYLCFGQISVYPKTGNYQLNIQKMYPSGLGEQQEKFEKLKAKLSLKGLFDLEKKKEIPKYPKEIGVITSQTGAAFQDIKNVLSRRYPCKIVLYHASVQGENAPTQLMAGINYFNTQRKVDLIILTRGGGSAIDLDCFNDENLAYSIFESEIPLISAIGHEIDFTIADFVSDLRAPTPSAAAEMATTNKEDILASLHYQKNKLNNYMENTFFYQNNILKNLAFRLAKSNLGKIISDKENLLEKYKTNLDFLSNKILENKKNKLQLFHNSLQKLSPYEVLKRGYALVFQDEKIVKSAKEIDFAKKIKIKFYDEEIYINLPKK